MKTITTYGAKVEIIPFKEFLKRIKVRQDDSKLYYFNTCLGYGDINKDDSESTYQRTAIYLSKLDETEVFKTQLVSQAHFVYWFKRDLNEMIEDAAVAHLERFGTAECIVNIAPRTWLVANPDDFIIVRGKNGAALVCYQKHRNLLFQISHHTEESALKGIGNIKLSDGSKVDLEEAKKNLRAI